MNHILQSPAESLIQQTLQSSNTIKTLQDLLNFISSDEKESLLEFGLKLAQQLPKPPQLPYRWIEKNWQDIYASWCQATNKKPVITNTKWENHPQRSEWLEIINQQGTSALIFHAGEFDVERDDFVKWAVANNLIEWN